MASRPGLLLSGTHLRLGLILQRIKEGAAPSKSSASLWSKDPLTRSQISALLKQSGKSIRATLPRREGMLMLAPYETATFTVLYRGYDIEVSRAPSGWRASVYPRSADLPILRRCEIQACDQDAAVIEAMDRVDGVLRL